MSYAHSFAPEFYGSPYECAPSDRPCNVCDAIASMSDSAYGEMAMDVFGCAPDYLDVDTVLAKIMETDTVSNLDSPVSVWIDSEGFYTVDVYDDSDAE